MVDSGPPQIVLAQPSGTEFELKVVRLKDKVHPFLRYMPAHVPQVLTAFLPKTGKMLEGIIYEH